MAKKTKKERYSLKTVEQVYSYWGKSLIAYKLGVSFFGYSSFLRWKTIEALNPRPGERILDLACGPGIMFSRIEKRIGPSGKLFGVDYVSEMIVQCEKLIKRRGWMNVSLIREDAAKLKLKSNSMDGIISVIGLSAVPDHNMALKKCHAILRRGGRLVILDGKDPKNNTMRFLIDVLRWSKSYEKKELIKDIKNIFGNIRIQEYALRTSFIAIAVKK